MPTKKPRVLVVGDFMLDIYRHTEYKKMAPDALVPVVTEKENTDHRLGGAGNVCANLSAMGCDVIACGPLGMDKAGNIISNMLNAGSCTEKMMVRVSDGTTVKETFVMSDKGKHAKKLFRLDADMMRCTTIATEVEQGVARILKNDAPPFDAILLEDYGKGALSTQTIKEIVQIAKAMGVPVFLDPSANTHWHSFEGVFCITPNRSELLQGDRFLCVGDAIHHACHASGASNVVATLDTDGCVVGNEKGYEPIPAQPQHVYDSSGAGDTFIAGLVAEYCRDTSSLPAAARYANAAAGLAVGKFGTSVISDSAVRQHLPPEKTAEAQKQYSIEEFVNVLTNFEEFDERTLVITNGCFDCLHAGHMQTLKYAKAQGDVLAVFVNNDTGVADLKGAGRPRLPLRVRMNMLADLPYVDYVVWFPGTHANPYMQQCNPDVVVKGGDSSAGAIKYLMGIFPQVKVAPEMLGVSTTNLLNEGSKADV